MRQFEIIEKMTKEIVMNLIKYIIIFTIFVLIFTIIFKLSHFSCKKVAKITIHFFQGTMLRALST